MGPEYDARFVLFHLRCAINVLLHKFIAFSGSDCVETAAAIRGAAEMVAANLAPKFTWGWGRKRERNDEIPGRHVQCSSPGVACSG